MTRKDKDKKAVFAHFEASSRANEQKRKPLNDAMDYKRSLIERGLKVGEFSDPMREIRFYLYMKGLEDAKILLEDELQRLLDDFKLGEERRKENEKNRQEDKERLDAAIAQLLALSKAYEETKAVLANVIATLKEQSAKSDVKAEAEKAECSKKQRRIRDVKQQLEAVKAKLQKLQEQALEEEEAMGEVACDHVDESSETQTDNGCDGETASVEANNNPTSEEKPEDEQGLNDNAGDRDTMPIDVEEAQSTEAHEPEESKSQEDVTPDVEANECATPEKKDSDSDNGINKAIEELERLKDRTPEVDPTAELHNPQDLKRIRELEREKMYHAQRAEQAIMELEKVKEFAEETKNAMEEMECDLEFKKHNDSSTSSVPSGKCGYGRSELRPPVNRDDSDAKKEPDKQENPDAQSDYDALHDPNKSPDARAKGENARSRGKPKGSNGGGMKLNTNAEQLPIHYCDPVECANCPMHDQCCKERLKRAGTRNVEDAVIQMVRNTYVRRKCYCPKHQKEISGEFPEGLEGEGTKQYGSVIRALAVFLNTYGFVSYERTATIINSFFATNLSHTTINNWVHSAAGELKEVMSFIGEALLQENVVYLDETGVRVDGLLFWLHTFCNENYTYLHADPKRGSDGTDRGGLMPFYTGTIVSDCWASYFARKNVRHGLCNAHLLRELYALVKFYLKDAAWAQELMDLMREMDHARNKKMESKATCFTEDELDHYWREYDRIVHRGLDLHNLPHEPVDRSNKKKAKATDTEAENNEESKGRKPLGKAVNLLLRLRDYKEMYLLFMKDFKVKFSNAYAEQSFRMVSKKRAIIGGFTTPQGADDWAVIWSYLDTCRKHDIGPAVAIKACFGGRNPADLLFTKEDQNALIKTREERLNDPANKEKLEALKELEKKTEEIFNDLDGYKAQKNEEREKRKQKQKEKEAKNKSASAKTTDKSREKAS